jgi:4-diphosphocytidyl-2-C-methyl-D-erythritol kinase
MSSPVVVVAAPAKLTLTLRVTGVRADGYHLIDAEMVTLDLADVVTIDPSGSGITVTGPFADGIPTDATNIVARALQLVGRSAAITIDKRIPHGGGLGGGSADAAAVLRWAGLTDVHLASRIGADVSFCLVGGRARVSGIGDVVEPLQARPGLPITLVIPPLSCSTPAVYRAWDALGGPTGAGRNDLLAAAIAVEPAMATWRDRIASAAWADVHLAGSGATWFLDGHHPDLREVLPNATVVLTTTTA